MVTDITKQAQEITLSELGQAALSYAMNAGWAVFPLHSIDDNGACSCGSAECRSQGKHPLTASGFKDATTDKDQIEEWWSTAPEANIGIPTGATSGFDVVDADIYKSDGTSLEALCSGHQLPETPISETGRGGLHYLFKHDPGHRGVAPEGIDWKSNGGYVVVPPSRGALQRYQWKASPDDVDLAPLPEWLRRPAPVVPTNGSTPNWNNECADVRRALTFIDPGGSRDDWLRIGMAIHDGSGGSDAGLVLWHSWSAGELHDAQPDNYSDLEDVQARWNSFGKGGGVTLGTLYKAATDNGFEYAPEIQISDKSPEVELPDLPTANEFLRLIYPEPEHLIGPIQNHNIVIIHGPTGIGKTQMAGAIGKALGTGQSWLHWAVQRSCRLLFIDAELPPGILQQRFSLHGIATDNVRVLNAVELSGTLGQGNHLNLADPHWQDVVWAYVTRYQSEVVLVDNVMSAISMPGVSMSSDEFWKPAYDLALKWRGAGLTSIWMDHSNSAGSIFGTKTKMWNADLVIKLSAPDDHDPEEGCRFVVEFEKHRGLHGELVRGFTAWMDTPEPTLTNIHPDTSWEMDWVTDSRQEEVWALSVSGLSVRKIASKTGVPKSTVADWVRRGKRLGKC